MGFYFENEFTKSFLKAIFEDINNRKLSLYLKGQKVKKLNFERRICHVNARF